MSELVQLQQSNQIYLSHSNEHVDTKEHLDTVECRYSWRLSLGLHSQ